MNQSMNQSIILPFAHRASIGIHINLQDINDNLPQFRVLHDNRDADDSPDAVDGVLRASLKENGRIGDEVTKLLIDDADEGINAAFDVRVKSVWAKPTLAGTKNIFLH